MTAASSSIEEGVKFSFNNAYEDFKSVTSSEFLNLTVRVGNLVRFIGSTSKQLLANARGLPVVGVIKLSGVLLFPLTILDTARSVVNFVKSTFNEKIDIVIGFVATVGAVIEVVANVAEGVSAIGLVTAKAVAWTTPLNIAAVVIEGVGMILSAKSLYESHRFSVLYENAASLSKSVEEYSFDDFNKARMLLEKNQSEEQSFIGKHFRTDSSKLMSRLKLIGGKAQLLILSGDHQKVMEGKLRLKTTMESLSQRMTAKKWSNALSILAASVGIVGFGVLFSPCPPAGFAVLAVSSVLSLINFFVDKHLTNRFEKELGIQ